MDLETFRTGSPLHFLCLAVCAISVAALVVIAKRNRDDQQALRRLKLFVGWGCLILWFVNTTWWLLPAQFDWRWSLPLHFCNLANLIGAAAVLGNRRIFKTIIYFWAIALCIWAFLTPVLINGPARPEFWVFWGYHLFILLALAEVLTVQNYRPGWKDYRTAWIFTFVYMIALATLDAFTGWDYGFVGPSTPSNPTLLDVLGPYPLRLLWMVLIGTVLFALLILPWRKRLKTAD